MPAEEEDLRMAEGIRLVVSDQSQLSSLREWIRGQPDVDVVVVPGTQEPGELGALDALMVFAGSAGVVEAVRTLPDFIRSRRSGFRVEVEPTPHGRRFILDASNVEEVLPILERLLDE